MLDVMEIIRRAAPAALAATLFVASPAASQGTPAPDDGDRREKVVVADFQTLNRSVNERDTTELSRVATSAARMFRERIREDGRYELVTPERLESTGSRLRSEGASCETSACAREAAREMGIQHVFRGRVIKISNLIWYLVVEHEDVATGEVLGQEAIELKGQRDVILPRAVAALHRWLLPAG